MSRGGPLGPPLRISADMGGCPQRGDLDAIRSRRSVRDYEDRSVDATALEHILDAACRAPSSNNQQAWDFMVVTERNRLQNLSQEWTVRRPRRELGRGRGIDHPTLRFGRAREVRHGPGGDEPHAGSRGSGPTGVGSAKGLTEQLVRPS